MLYQNLETAINEYVHYRYKIFQITSYSTVNECLKICLLRYSITLCINQLNDHQHTSAIFMTEL